MPQMPELKTKNSTQTGLNDFCSKHAVYIVRFMRHTCGNMKITEA